MAEEKEAVKPIKKVAKKNVVIGIMAVNKKIGKKEYAVGDKIELSPKAYKNYKQNKYIK